MATVTKKKYSISVDGEMDSAIKTAAKAINVTPTAYIWLCVEGRGRLLQENSNLKARLRETPIKHMPPPTFD